MVVNEKVEPRYSQRWGEQFLFVEPRCLSGWRGAQVLILCYHQRWDSRNDCIVRETFPVALVSVVNEFQIFQIEISFSPSTPYKLYQMQKITPVLPLYHRYKEHRIYNKQKKNRKTIMTHWSTKRPTYLVQSDWYISEISWCVCQTRSMSKVGTKNVAGDEAMRSRKLKSYQ